MGTSSLVGAPLSRFLIVTVVVASIAAAVTASQHLFHLPFTPHLSRDHQLYRLAAHHLVYANSAELFLGTLVLWQSSVGLERIFGTRKYASFLVTTTALSTLLSLLGLVVGSQLTRGRVNVLPSGPFAVTSAIVCQSHRLTPTLYTFRLFHPALTLNNRFPFYLLSFFLALSQPPSTLLLALIGTISSFAWSNDLVGLSRYRIPRRAYKLLARLGPADGARERLRRGTAAEHDEALLASLAGGGAGGFASAAAGIGGVNVAALRAPAAPALPAPAATAEPAVPAGAATDLTAALPPPSGVNAAVPTQDTVRSLPPISGTSFLRQWQAGLTGAPEGPTAAQIADLSGIFPHHSRPAIIAALQTSGHDVTRAAEMLLSEGG